MSFVIGIDPSLNGTGVCILYSDRLPRLLTVTAGKDTGNCFARRLTLLQAALRAACLPATSTPLLAAIETPISPLALSKSRGGGGYNNNVMAYGTCYEMLGRFRVPYIDVTPNQRAMIATGKGNAKKEDVVKAWDGLMIAHDSIKIDHNQVDAFFIAMAAAEVISDKFKPFTGWLDLDDRVYDMLETLEIRRP